jgi:hypothetical protein
MTTTERMRRKEELCQQRVLGQDRLPEKARRVPPRALMDELQMVLGFQMARLKSSQPRKSI